MKLALVENGKEIIRKDPLDLDYIEYDIVNDYLKIIGHLEKSPSARIEIDLTVPYIPKYNLVNCNSIFTQKFNQILKRRMLA